MVNVRTLHFDGVRAVAPRAHHIAAPLASAIGANRGSCSEPAPSLLARQLLDLAASQLGLKNFAARLFLPDGTQITGAPFLLLPLLAFLLLLLLRFLHPDHRRTPFPPAHAGLPQIITQA